MTAKTHAEFTAARILLSSDNHLLVSPLRNALLRAGLKVDVASDYSHLDLLWQELNPEIVLIEVSDIDSVEAATQAALRIKQCDSQQFVAYLADSELLMSGLTGDAIFPRDAARLPQILRETLDALLDPSR